MSAPATEQRVGTGLIRLLRVDITTLDVDVVVNAANAQLAGGGGVDGAIHRAAGDAELQEELRGRYPDGCPTGSAVITGGHRMRPRHIVHAVGPRWSSHRPEECDRLLASAYATALRMAALVGAYTVALPSISTGIYGFPIDRAAPIALSAARAALADAVTPLRELSFALFSAADLEVYRQALDALPA